MVKRAKILVVDDEPTNIEIIEEIIGGLYTLKAVFSGEEALQEIYKFNPDIVLLDVMLPGIDGYEVCKTIKNDEAIKGTKILLVSAKAMVEEIKAGFEVGADGYITKPFEAENLKAQLQKHLQSGD